MPVSPFPTLTRLYEQELSPKRPVTKSPDFADGGCDYILGPTAAVTRRWVLRFGNLSAAQAATLDAHADEAGYDDEDGSAHTFTFTDRYGVAHTVRYDRGGYERDHIKTWMNSREVRLIKRP